MQQRFGAHTEPELGATGPQIKCYFVYIVNDILRVCFLLVAVYELFSNLYRSQKAQPHIA